MKDLIKNIYKTLFFFDFSLVVISLLPDIKSGNPMIPVLCRQAMHLAVIVVFTLFFVLVLEKRRVKLQLKGGGGISFLTGLSFGLLPIVFTVIVLRVFKTLTITGNNPADNLLLWTLILLMNTAVYELLLRGYLYQLFKKYYSTPVVITFITLLCVALNPKMVFNPVSALNIIAMNILLCLLREYSKTLIAPLIAHFIYNFISIIAFGSLKFDEAYPVLINISLSGNKYIAGGSFMFEGSIVLLAANAATIGLLIFLLRKRAQKAGIANPRYM